MATGNTEKVVFKSSYASSHCETDRNDYFYSLYTHINNIIQKHKSAVRRANSKANGKVLTVSDLESVTYENAVMKIYINNPTQGPQGINPSNGQAGKSRQGDLVLECDTSKVPCVHEMLFLAFARYLLMKVVVILEKQPGNSRKDAFNRAQTALDHKLYGFENDDRFKEIKWASNTRASTGA